MIRSRGQLKLPDGTEQEFSAGFEHLESATRRGCRFECLLQERRSKAVLFSVLFPANALAGVREGLEPLPSRHMSDRLLRTLRNAVGPMFQKADPDHML